MESSSSGKRTERGHSRQASTGRSAAPLRRSIRNALEADDDPLNDPLASSQVLSPDSKHNMSQHPSSTQTPRLASPNAGSNLSNLSTLTSTSFHTARTSLTPGTSSLTQKAFPHLLRPEIYHPVPTHDIPAAFLNSPLQPDTAASVEDLVASGSFRHAAIKAATQLTSGDLAPTDYEEIFRLLYIRLACLTLCGRTDIAAQESRVLEDLGSAIYGIEDDDGVGRTRHIVPWELRVLAIRLQGLGFGDVRRGVVGYYELAREARHAIFLQQEVRERLEGGDLDEAAEMDVEDRIWQDRLQDLGIRVASALIEMEDLEGASRHIRSLPTGVPHLQVQKALLWLAIGDVRSARSCFPEELPSSDTTPSEEQLVLRSQHQIIEALVLMADGSYDLAASEWEDLLSHAEGDIRTLYVTNLSVCYLYTGRGEDARAQLEELVDQGHNFRALTFNLCTLYELCSERSRSLKLDLAERVANGAQPRAEGWEKVLVDFKL